MIIEVERMQNTNSKLERGELPRFREEHTTHERVVLKNKIYEKSQKSR